MRLFSVNNKLVNKNVSRFRIDWEKKSRSLPQWETKQFFKKYWINHQVYEEFPCFGSLLKVDILNLTIKIAVEVNGPQHYGMHHFHNNSPLNYLNGFKNDVKKEEWCERNGIKLIELKDTEVKLLSPSFLREMFGLAL